MNPTLKGIDQWPNTALSSPATPSESPERVETAEEAFQGLVGGKTQCLEDLFLDWYENKGGKSAGTEGSTRYLFKGAKETFMAGFHAGYEAGRKAK